MPEDKKKEKTRCVACGAEFPCAPTPGKCWCEKYPILKVESPLPGCFCESCLRKALIAQGETLPEEKPNGKL